MLRNEIHNYTISDKTRYVNATNTRKPRPSTGDIRRRLQSYFTQTSADDESIAQQRAQSTLHSQYRIYMQLLTFR